MNILLDAFGGDNAPLEPIKGAIEAVKEYGIQVTLVGDEEKIRACAKENNLSLEGIGLAHAGDVMPMCADPSGVMKEHPDSSIAVGCKLLKEHQGDAFVSAGSTGALLVAASLTVRRIKGIKRAALGTLIPCANGCYMLMDCGANAECRPDMLAQFAVMGSAYMSGVRGLEKPRIGLVNNGTEESKGDNLHKEAHAILKRIPIHFIGNVEAREIPFGACDVAVTDGFTGNAILKLTEGLGSFFSKFLKGMFTSSTKTKLAYLMVKDGVNDFKKMMDYTEYGGAPLLGIAKPVIKAHGSSNAKAFKNAIRQAKECLEGDVIGKIEAGLAQMKEEMEKMPQPAQEE